LSKEQQISGQDSSDGESGRMAGLSWEVVVLAQAIFVQPEADFGRD